MSKKIIIFMIQIIFACGVSVFTFGIGGMFSTSLNVICELQNDGTYICQARDTLLGLAFSGRQAEHVIGLEQHVKCSGTGSRKGCSEISEFVTATGDRIKLSSWFTTSKSQVTELVNTINGLMKTNSRSINYTSDISPWLIFSAGLSLFLFLTFFVQALWGLFQKNNDNEPAVIIIK